MSETPLTDKALRNTQGLFRAAAETNGFADHARQLERKMVEAQTFIEREYGPLLSREQEALEQLTVLRRSSESRERVEKALRDHLPALKALMDLHDEDVDMDEFPDSDSIGSGQNEAGEVYDLPMTFGHLRRARKALAALHAASKEGV